MTPTDLERLRVAQAEVMLHKQTILMANESIKELEAENKQLRSACEMLANALRYGVGLEPLPGLEPRRFSEALESYERIKRQLAGEEK